MAFIDRYNQGIRAVEHRMVDLTEMASNMLGRSLEVLLRADPDGAQEVIDYDDVVDAETDRIEQAAIELISLQQPAQEDLRVLTAALRVVRDLERIGDYACDIAEIAQELESTPDLKPLGDVSRMGDLTRSMLRRAGEAFVSKNPQIAYEVSRRDDAVDQLYLNLHHELMDVMRRDPLKVAQAANLLLVARYLERVADHTVNLAEMTIYMAQGVRQPFRHSPRSANAEAVRKSPPPK